MLQIILLLATLFDYLFISHTLETCYEINNQQNVNQFFFN